MRQQIDAVMTNFDGAQRKHDAAAVAALYTLDAIQVLDWTGGCTVLGREAIEKALAANFASSPPDVTGKLLQIRRMQSATR